jgi:Uma2 family endonuclease
MGIAHSFQNSMNVASPLVLVLPPGTGTAPIDHQEPTLLQAIARPKRFTVADYHRLIELGFLQEGDRIELINGELFEMAAKGSPHAVCTGLFCRELDRLVGDQVAVRNQEPITLFDNSEPEPDIVIAEGKIEDYLAHHPVQDDVLIVIEIADSSLVHDRTIKLATYAEANIPHYWIANVKTNQLECHSQPYQDWLGEFAYQTRKILLSSQSIEIPGFPDRLLNLNKIFPPVPQA